MSEYSINPDKSCGPKISETPRKSANKPSQKSPKSLNFDDGQLEAQPHTASSSEAGGGGYVVAGVVSTLAVLGKASIQ